MGEEAFILPSIEALANLCLTPEQQVTVGQARSFSVRVLSHVWQLNGCASPPGCSLVWPGGSDTCVLY